MMASILAKDIRKKKPVKMAECPLCATKGLKSALHSITIAPKVKIRMCSNRTCEYPFTSDVRKRMRLKRTSRQSAAGKVADVTAAWSEGPSSVDNYDWLDQLPLEAFSESGSVAGTSGPPSPAGPSWQDGDSSLAAVEDLLRRSSEDILSVGYESYCAFAPSVIDNDEALFATLRSDPRAILQESHARMASRAASPASRRASDVETDGESGKMEKSSSQPVTITESAAPGTGDATGTSQLTGLSALDLLNDDALFACVEANSAVLDEQTVQQPSEPVEEDVCSSSSAWSPSRMMLSAAECDADGETCDQHPTYSRKKLRRRKDLDATARRVSCSSSSSGSRSDSGGRRSSESSHSTVVDATGDGTVVCVAAEPQPWSEEISQPVHLVRSENQPEAGDSLKQDGSEPVEPARESSSDDDDRPVGYRPRKRRRMALSGSSEREQPAAKKGPNHVQPTAEDLFGDVSDDETSPGSTPAATESSVSAQPTEAIQSKEDERVIPGEITVPVDGNLSQMISGDGDKNMSSQPLAASAGEVEEKSAGDEEVVQPEAHKSFDMPSLDVEESFVAPVSAPVAHQYIEEDEYSPVIPSPEADEEPSVVESSIQETTSQEADDEKNLPSPADQVSPLPERENPKEQLRTDEEVSVPTDQPAREDERVDSKAPSEPVGEETQEDGEEGWTFSECSAEDMKALEKEGSSSSSSTYTHSSEEDSSNEAESGGRKTGDFEAEAVAIKMGEESSSIRVPDEDHPAVEWSLHGSAGGAPVGHSTLESDAGGIVHSEAIVSIVTAEVTQPEASGEAEPSMIAENSGVFVANTGFEQPTPGTYPSIEEYGFEEQYFGANEGDFDAGAVASGEQTAGEDAVPKDFDLREPFPDDSSVEEISQAEDDVVALQPLQPSVDDFDLPSDPVYAVLRPIDMEIGALAPYEPSVVDQANEPVCVFELKSGGLSVVRGPEERKDGDGFVASTPKAAPKDSKEKVPLTERLQKLFEPKLRKKNAAEQAEFGTPATRGTDRPESADYAPSPYASSVDSGFSYAGEDCHVEVRLDSTPFTSRPCSQNSFTGLFPTLFSDPVDDYFFRSQLAPSAGPNDDSAHVEPVDASKMPGQIPTAVQPLANKVLKLQDRTVQGEQVQDYTITPLPTQKRILTALPARDGAMPAEERGLRLVLQGDDRLGGLDQVGRLLDQPDDNGECCFSAAMNGPIEGRRNGLVLKAVGYRLAGEDEIHTSGGNGFDNGDGGASSIAHAEEPAGLDDELSECESDASGATEDSSNRKLLKRQLFFVGEDGRRYRASGEIPIGAVVKERKTLVTQCCVYECTDGTVVEERRVYEEAEQCVLIPKPKPFGQVVDFKPRKKTQRFLRSDDISLNRTTRGGEDLHEVGSEEEVVPWSSWKSKKRSDSDDLESLIRTSMRRDDVRLLKNQGIPMEYDLTTKEVKNRATLPLWGSKMNPTRSKPLAVTEVHREQVRKAKQHLMKAVAEAQTADLWTTNRKEKEDTKKRKRRRR